MKILMVGAFSGWMGLHLSHFAAALRHKGAEVIPADYHHMERLFGLFKIGDAAERRDRAMERVVRQFQPDLILFVASWKFDINRLRSYFHGRIAVYDFDGPRRKSVDDFLTLRCVDRFFTVSNFLVRQLKQRGMESSYLPHGVDTDYYAPGELSDAVQKKFAAPISYIGRATARRVQLCCSIQSYGLALYGERWSKNHDCRAAGLTSCIRLDRDIAKREVVDVYRSSNAVLNVLQEPLDEYRTILSIQCFAIPATAACLIAEEVEELPAAFEPNREVLCFRTTEELIELVKKCTMEPGFARAIGESGRRRCLAEHQWSCRVEDFLAYW